MTVRTFDEMRNDSAKLYTSHKAMLERRLISLQEDKASLAEEDYKKREVEITKDLGMLERWAALEKETIKAAMTDQLTGVLGNNYIRQRINFWSFESPDGLAVLMWDIDHFKEVNDRVDHTYGDHALKLIVSTTKKRLDEAIGSHKYLHLELGRYGGEEFIAGLFHFIDDENYLKEIADYVRIGVADLKLSEDEKIPEDLRKRTFTVVGKIHEENDGTIWDMIKKYVDPELTSAKRENRRNSTIILPRRCISY